MRLIGLAAIACLCAGAPARAATARLDGAHAPVSAPALTLPLSERADDVVRRAALAAYPDELALARVETAQLAAAKDQLPAWQGRVVDRLDGLLARPDAELLGPRLQDELELLRREWIAKIGEPEPAVTRGPRPLADLLGERSIGSVFNGDAGRGRWQRDVERQPWLAPGATVVGYDRVDPSVYRRQGRLENGVVPGRDWRHLTMTTSVDDSAFPAPASVDLAHVAFLDMKRGWEARLKLYQSRVRPGGWLLLAHSDTYQWGAARGQLIGAALAAPGRWRVLADFPQHEVPADYPVTEWWRTFSAWGRNFLLALRSEASR